MASMMSLPPEIIAEVFEWAILPSTQYACGCNCDLSSTSLCQYAVPINISGVCRVWRQISLGQPSLWANIGIWAEGVEDVQRALQRAKTWLQRSSSAPLTLHISVSPRTGEGEKTDDTHLGKAVDCLFRELDNHKNRCEKVAIFLGGVLAAFLDSQCYKNYATTQAGRRPIREYVSG